MVVVGAQWGDEGKGKVVDILANQADGVVRFNGGNNAGHTVVVGTRKFKLSLLPSGVAQRKKLFLSQGVVIEPKVLLDEIEYCRSLGIKVDLMIDPRCHIVMPYHKALDAATEKWKGKKATGSLHLGIGYCYEDRNNRFGVRFEDLIDPNSLKEKLSMYYPLKKRQIEKVFEQPFEITEEQIFQSYKTYGRKLKQYLGDVSLYLSKVIKTKKILFEGAHGTFLDAVFGTYPYTTAVNTIASSALSYAGIVPQKLYGLGIVKAYTTRVGNGPFPTELFDKLGDTIRAVGAEFGTVSKRPRRCGWLDLPMIRTAVRLSGFDYLAITKLDVLSSLSVIKICTHYELGGKKITEIPAMIKDFVLCRPVYREFKGWNTDISKIKKFSKLPISAQIYLKFIEKSLKVPIKYVFVGPEREQTIIN